MQNEAISTKSVAAAICTDHHVHFYDTEKTLSEAVAEFIEAGVKAGQPLVET